MARRKAGASKAPDPREKIPEILDQIASGKSLRAICLQEGFPHLVSFLRWVRGDENLEKAYRLAIELRADVYFDQIMEIADTPLEGEKVKFTEDGDGQKTETTTGDMIEHRRLQVDARKWALARMNAKKYGDKVDVQHGGKVKIVPMSRDDEAI